MAPRAAQTFRTVILPLALPGVIAGSIFTFSLTLGDYIIPQIIGTSARFIGLAVYQLQGTAGNIPLAAAFAVVPIADHAGLSDPGQTRGGFRCTLNALLGLEDRGHRWASVPAPADPADLPLRLHDRGTDLPVPAARPDHRNGSPSPGTATDIWPPLYLSLKVAAISTVLALILGTLVAAAMARARFFGRDQISLLILLPIALPGVITGMSLRSAFGDHGHPVLDLDHRSGPRDLLHRHRLQQRRRPVPPPVGRDHGGVVPTLAPTPSRPSAMSCCPTSARPCWRAACWPLRCRSTR